MDWTKLRMLLAVLAISVTPVVAIGCGDDDGGDVGSDIEKTVDDAADDAENAADDAADKVDDAADDAEKKVDDAADDVKKKTDDVDVNIGGDDVEDVTVNGKKVDKDE